MGPSPARPFPESAEESRRSGPMRKKKLTDLKEVGDQVRLLRLRHPGRPRSRRRLLDAPPHGHPGLPGGQDLRVPRQHPLGPHLARKGRVRPPVHDHEHAHGHGRGPGPGRSDRDRGRGLPLGRRPLACPGGPQAGRRDPGRHPLGRGRFPGHRPVRASPRQDLPYRQRPQRPERERPAGHHGPADDHQHLRGLAQRRAQGLQRSLPGPRGLPLADPRPGQAAGRRSRASSPPSCSAWAGPSARP